jgi:hypothetical protein
MILVKCQNGVVLFRVSTPRTNEPRKILCLNDGQVVEVKGANNLAIVNVIEMIVQHSAQLKGAVQFLTDIELG